MDESKTTSMHGNETFVLVHGAWSGAWYWNRKLVPLLNGLGHRAIAFDWPAHGADGADILQQTFAAYVKRTVKQIEDLPGEVILVGHSLGGSVVTQVAEEIPEKIKKLVYLTAFMPQDGQSGCGTDGSGIDPISYVDMSQDGVSVVLPDNMVDEVISQNCSGADRAFFKENKCPEVLEALSAPVHTTEERWGSLRRFFIYCLQDQAISLDVQKRMVEGLPCEKVYSLDSDHCPFLCVPEELAVVLHDISRQ